MPRPTPLINLISFKRVVSHIIKQLQRYFCTSSLLLMA